MEKIILPILILTLATGCAGNIKHNSEVSCAVDDWEQLGFDIAMSGKHVRYFDRYKEACEPTLSEESVGQYVDGYTRGAMHFCTYDTGYSYGEKGMRIPEVCPFEVRKLFVQGYKQGAFDRSERVRQLEAVSEEANKPGPSQIEQLPTQER